ncbi:unnamed protein product [Amoebophrya sp. A25]|nr:unnamed protein product [Amoebophrya sp. A25]|eukprot:GSA25T00006768001.1
MHKVNKKPPPVAKKAPSSSSTSAEEQSSSTTSTTQAAAESSNKSVQEVTLDPSTNQVMVDGKPLPAGSIENLDKAFSALPGMNEDEEDEEETPEECFVNDARFGELEDIKLVLADEEAASHLINAQIEPNGSTALMMAAANGHEEVVEALLAFRGKNRVAANLLLQNKAGNTALHWAAMMGRKKVAQLLLEAETGSKICSNPAEQQQDSSSSAASSTSSESANMFNEAKRKPFDEAQLKGYSALCELIAPYTNFEYCSPEPDPETDRKYGLGGA